MDYNFLLDCKTHRKVVEKVADMVLSIQLNSQSSKVYKISISGLNKILRLIVPLESHVQIYVQESIHNCEILLGCNSNIETLNQLVAQINANEGIDDFKKQFHDVLKWFSSHGNKPIDFINNQKIMGYMFQITHLEKYEISPFTEDRRKMLHLEKIVSNADILNTKLKEQVKIAEKFEEIVVTPIEVMKKAVTIKNALFDLEKQLHSKYYLFLPDYDDSLAWLFILQNLFTQFRSPAFYLHKDFKPLLACVNLKVVDKMMALLTSDSKNQCFELYENNQFNRVTALFVWSKIKNICNLNNNRHIPILLLPMYRENFAQRGIELGNKRLLKQKKLLLDVVYLVNNKKSSTKKSTVVEHTLKIAKKS